MIFDVILGKALSANYINGLYTNRIDIEEINDYPTLVRLIHSSLVEAFDQVDKLPETVSAIINRFGLYANEDDVDSGVINPDDEYRNKSMDIKIRELLSALSYEGYEFYIVRRPDLKNTVVPDSTRAYLLDKHDTLFPTLNRIINGSSLTFDDPEYANISAVVMQFIQDLNLEDIVEDSLDLKVYESKYNALAQAHMEWTLDVRGLIRFLDDYGYKILVVM